MFTVFTLSLLTKMYVSMTKIITFEPLRPLLSFLKRIPTHQILQFKKGKKTPFSFLIFYLL